VKLTTHFPPVLKLSMHGAIAPLPIMASLLVAYLTTGNIYLILPVVEGAAPVFIWRVQKNCRRPQDRWSPSRDPKWAHHDYKSEPFCLSQLARWKPNILQLIFLQFTSGKSRDISQAVGRWLSISVGRVRSQFRSCGIYDGCQPYAPTILYLPGRFLVLISVIG
jgi:hypothetical protein